MDKIRGKEISTLIFLWLHNQTFYKKLQNTAAEKISSAVTIQEWADIGCSTGLISRIAARLNYTVTGYDIDSFSLLVAKSISLHLKNISYKKQDFLTIKTKYDIVSATSLLSVVNDEKAALQKLLSLLKNSDSTLIIIEPTEMLTLKNVYKLITNLQAFWHFKGLLLWAKAREGKHIDMEIFETVDEDKISYIEHLNGMVRVFYIKG